MNEKNYKNRKMYILAGACSCIGCLVMMASPSIALNAARKGIALWASSVLPALLPFFICANFMTVLGLPMQIGRILEQPFRKLFSAPGVSAFVFTVSITSGYPMGAKLIGDFGRNGTITEREAKRMITFCSTSGPLFILGAVGTGMLASPAAGAVIAVSHYLGAILNGLLYRFMLPDTGESFIRAPKKAEPVKGNLLDLFTDSMILSFRALGIICGYIVLFMLFTDFVTYSGVLSHFKAEYIQGFIKGCFEMTVGCSSIAESSELPLLYQCMLCSFLISFGGLSVYAQSMSMLAGLRIGNTFYLTAKLTHGLLAAASAWFIGPLLLQKESLAVWTLSREEIFKSFGFYYQLLFSTKMIIMVVILFLITFSLDKMIRRFHESFRNHSGI